MAPALDVGRRMRLQEPEQFHAMVKMHLSFLLDLHTDDCDCSFLTEKQEKVTVDSKLKKAFTPMKKAKAKGVMDGVPLTQEGVCQVYQIIEFLGRPHNIVTEGIFRKHGNLKKQQALKERLNRGVRLDLDDEEFSVHECAAVLKQFLANLPEPLLTDAYYQAHCQVPLLLKKNISSEEREAAELKQVSCVQLLFQLIPPVHLALLKDLLLFLQAVAAREAENKMNSTNLGTLFSTHILCPRKLSPEALQANHLLLSSVVTFMIEHAEKLFVLPDKLLLDVQTYIAKRDAIQSTPVAKTRNTEHDGPGSPVVSTVFSFVDRPASQAVTVGNMTDKALAQLYAHVQGMPASAHKRRLVKQLNEANGKGTPEVATSGSVRVVGRQAGRHRRRSGDGIINLLTPRRKRPAVTGSYSVQGAGGSRSRRELVTPSNSFRRQNSTPVAPSCPPPRASLLSPSHMSSPAVMSPCRERLPSPSALQSTPASQVSEVGDVDEVDTPGRESCTSSPSTAGSEGEGGERPPLPPRTPAPPLVAVTCATPTSLSPGVRRAMATPRSRGGLMVSVGQLDKWNKLLDPKPAQLHFDEEDEEGEEEEGDLEEEEAMDEEEEEAEGAEDGEEDEVLLDYERITERGKAGVYRSLSLSTGFRAYLAEQGLEAAPGEDSELDTSLLAADTSLLDASYSEEVRRLLRAPQDELSTSMQEILDGGEPSDSSESLSEGRSLSGRSCGSSSTLRALSQIPVTGCENVAPEQRQEGSVKEATTSPVKAASLITVSPVKVASQATASPVKAASLITVSPVRRGVKRRSLTDSEEVIKPLQVIQPGAVNSKIFFETDL